MLGTQPTTGVKGAKPNLPTRETFKTAKQELPELSRSHLQTRNRQMASKAALAEVALLEKKANPDSQSTGHTATGISAYR